MSIDLRLGDCLEILKTFPENHSDACVTDSPYAIGFMGRKWDLADIEKAVSRRGAYGPYGTRKDSGRTSTGFGAASSVVETYDLTPKGLAAFQALCTHWGTEVLRVLKPGAHILAFGLPRTSHRLVCGLEDAGFEIRDTLVWLYGSGFPKSLDVSKAIDKELGSERPVVGRKTGRAANPKSMDITGGRYGSDHGDRDVSAITAPATDDAARWSGWGTALKPAYEPIVLARKPLDGTVVENVLKWGVGGLNIQESRVPFASTADREKAHDNALGPVERFRTSKKIYDGGRDSAGFADTHSPAGRWPANVLLDEDAATLLDEQTGVLKSGHADILRRGTDKFRSIYHPFGGQEVEGATYGDFGGASRFFYCAKASREERERGLDRYEWVYIVADVWEEAWGNAAPQVRLLVDTAQSPPRVIGAFGCQRTDAGEWNTMLFGNEDVESSQRASGSTTATATSSTTGSRTLNWLTRSHTSDYTPVVNSGTVSGGNPAGGAEGSDPSATFTSEAVASLLGASGAASRTRWKIRGSAGRVCSHPTVKPMDLMRYLVRLVTPSGGTVLDPFAGSGTTLIAAALDGFDAIGIEKESEYVDIARARIRGWFPLETSAEQQPSG